jgi:hypothetical protein
MNEPEDVQQLLRGIGVRAALLGVGGLIVSGTLAAITLRAASGMIKIALGTTLLLIGSGVAAWEVKKMQRYIEAPA